MNEKSVGYFLLITGILVMVSSAVGVFLVLSGRMKSFDVFSLPPVTLDLSGLMQAENPDAQLPPEANLKTEIVKSEVLNKPMNIIAHLLFMTLLVSIGHKISSLGVQLLRPIKVNLRGDKSILEPN